MRTLVTEVEKCATCPRMMRPHRAKAADYPGTVARSGRQCFTCYMNAYHEEKRQEQPERETHVAGIRPGFDARQATGWMESYVAGRRRRGIEPHGVVMAGETKSLAAAWRQPA